MIMMIPLSDVENALAAGPSPQAMTTAVHECPGRRRSAARSADMNARPASSIAARILGSPSLTIGGPFQQAGLAFCIVIDLGRHAVGNSLDSRSILRRGCAR